MKNTSFKTLSRIGIWALCTLVFIIGCQTKQEAALINVGSTEQTPSQVSPSPTGAATPTASKVKFTSAYTKLDVSRCKSIKEAPENEDEASVICKGYGQYKIFIGEHGLVPPIYIGKEISANLDAWDAAELATFYYHAGNIISTIEWRLANGVPFACIIRQTYDESTIDPDKIGTVNQLVIRNLKGFKKIDATVDARTDKNANKEARKIADEGYGKITAANKAH